MSGMTESAQVKRINELLGERWRNTVSGRCYLLTSERSGLCTLEGIDRRVIEVHREILEYPKSTWERIV